MDAKAHFFLKLASPFTVSFKRHLLAAETPVEQYTPLSCQTPTIIPKKTKLNFGQLTTLFVWAHNWNKRATINEKRQIIDAHNLHLTAPTFHHLSYFT